MLFNNLRNFESEEEALKAADTELLSLLNNKTLLIPDKYSTLLSEYRKKQEDFNSEISLTIKNQVLAIMNMRILLQQILIYIYITWFDFFSFVLRIQTTIISLILFFFFSEIIY